MSNEKYEEIIIKINKLEKLKNRTHSQDNNLLRFYYPNMM